MSRRHTASRGPKLIAALALGLQALLFSPSALTASFDYELAPREIADGVYVLVGLKEDFSFDNGGNIVNTGFIVGPSGITVIDTGSSKRYGEQLRNAIARISPLPIVKVINTHHHPDHFLGNQAFPADTLSATAVTMQGIGDEGPAFLDNMYRLNGDWMLETEIAAPHAALAAGRIDAGGRTLELIALSGHTPADLAVLDIASGTLFASDLVFNGRAPTTPHASIDQWLKALDQLQQIDFRHIVPGHGDPATDKAPIEQTRRYLQWLQQSIREGAEQGLDMTEMLARPVPAEFSGLAEVSREYLRSVTHLYPAAEQAALSRGSRR
ncbi:MBL fold metallo-hydrolase [Parazoarcus communis]|uniref:MBL fold metallo-hydrolase n=1 Tax=Parazoarcus communis TaxID=41977 RepID=A0A2U8GPL7_9RHOO|nr:quinoprotein relay system zinc metallohydrolase 1 [Parazoarcus communis]AWI75430.1 MBL fold metallo-hydrolase [Parazoarcus communis]